MAFEPLEQRQLLNIDIGNLPFHRVVDNQDAAYSETGGYWASWSDSSSYGGDFRYHAGGDGSDGAAATWTFDSLDPTKSYQIFITWSNDGNRASNSPLTVLDGTTALLTALINQQFAPDDATGEGTTWESLGVYQAGSGTLNVRLGDAADNYVIADAVCVAEVPPAATPPSVIDEGDAAYAETGSGWLGWSEQGAYQGDFRYHAPGTGDNAATWTFDGLDPTKRYQVLTTWNPQSNRASNSPFSVWGGAGPLATVRLNQQFAASDVTLDGRGWESLGVYTADSGTLVVKLTDDANGDVIADGVRLVEVPPVTTPPSVIDEGDTAYSETGSDWLGWSEQGAYQGDFRYHAPGTGENRTSWKFSALPVGVYEVYVTWNSQSNRATDSPFTVMDGTNALATTRLNQRLAPSDAVYDAQGWASLGLYSIHSGALTVELSDDDVDGFVVADGVRIEEVSSTAAIEDSYTASESTPFWVGRDQGLLANDALGPVGAGLEFRHPRQLHRLPQAGRRPGADRDGGPELDPAGDGQRRALERDDGASQYDSRCGEPDPRRPRDGHPRGRRGGPRAGGGRHVLRDHDSRPGCDPRPIHVRSRCGPQRSDRPR